MDVLYILPHFCILMVLLQWYLPKTAAILKKSPPRLCITKCEVQGFRDPYGGLVSILMPDYVSDSLSHVQLDSL